MIKFFKMLTVGLSLLIAVYLQITFNRDGYNYYLISLLVIIALYFDEIKTMSFGALKLEKFEKISNHIDQSTIYFYSSQMRLIINQQLSGLGQSSGLWYNYNDLNKLFLHIDELPKDLQTQLHDEYKKTIKYALKRQRRLLGVKSDWSIPPSSFEELDIPENIKKKPDFEKAKQSYITLYKRLLDAK